jgi:hypothetical protein
MTRALLTVRDLAATPIPNGLIGWWIGNYANVPAPWVIDDTLCDGRFPKGSNVANTTTDTATHNHAVTLTDHGHTLDNANPTVGVNNSEGDSNRFFPTHTHSVPSTTDLGAFDEATNIPTHVEAIPIRYNNPGAGTARGIVKLSDLAADALLPLRAIGGYLGDVLPPNWALCDGSTVRGVVTPNLVGKFLRGYTTSPGTVGTTGTHNHTANHYHACSGSSTAGGAEGGSDRYICSNTHVHGVQTTNITLPNSSPEPPSRTLKFICFTGYGRSNAQKADPKGLIRAADLSPDLLCARGVILATVDTTDTTGFAVCNAVGAGWSNGTPTGCPSTRPYLSGKFIRHPANGTTNTTGASVGDDTHGHTGGAHMHTSGVGNNEINVAGVSGSNVAYHRLDGVNHVHTLGAITWVGNTAGASTNAGNHVPPYVEVAFLVRD